MTSLMRTAANSSGRKINSFRDWLARRQQAQVQSGFEPYAIDWDTLAESPVYARIEHGRWIADCECNGAELVDPDDPYFYCISCQSIGVSHTLRPVVFPEITKRVEIERVIALRPSEDNRHWFPGESITQLKAENVILGVRDS